MSAFEPSDGIAETVERQLQVAAAGATVSGRAIAAKRQQALREAQDQSEDAARTLRARQRHERELASTRISPVFEDAWWDIAAPQEIASMWQEATSWATYPEERALGPTPSIFDHAVARISHEVHERSGLDVTDIVVLAELQQLEHPHHANAPTGDTATAERPPERSETPTLGTEHLAADPPNVAEHPARVFDDPERRERLRERLAHSGVPDDAIQARVLADIGQARDPAQATRNAGEESAARQRPPGRKATEQRRLHR